MGAPLKWLPLYVDELETDGSYRALSWEERGVFIALLCWQWREGAVPADPRPLARMLGARVPVVRNVLAAMFIEDGSEDRVLVNRKLAEVRVHQLQKAQKASMNARSLRTGEERYLYAAEMQPIKGMSNEQGPVQVKIGWSRNPKTRVTTLARELRQRVILIGMKTASIAVERQAHVDLAADAIGGEWFRGTPAVYQWLTDHGITSGKPRSG